MSAHCGPRVIGVDLGGTNIRAAVLQGTRVLSDVRLATPQIGGAAAVNATMLAAVAELLARPAGDGVAAIGLGIPGLVDPARGYCNFSPNLFWRDEPVAALFHERFGLPVAMDNDVRVATCGELTYGAGQGIADFICIAIGTGIGSGIVLGGRLYRGHAFAGGEIGHMTVEKDGPPCNCGNHGCIEAFAGALAIAAAGRRAVAAGEAPVLASLADGNPDRVNPALIAQAAQAGDAGAAAVFARAGEYLGIGLASLANVLNPSHFIIGGGVANAGELFLGPARRVLRERAMPVNARTATIVTAALGQDAGLIGAGVIAGLALQSDRWWEQ